MKKIVLSLGLLSGINCYALDSLLLNGINCSESSPSTHIVSQTTEVDYLEINNKTAVKIPQGTKFLGNINNTSCHVRWEKIIFPDGSSVTVENYGVYSDLLNKIYRPGNLIEIKESAVIIPKDDFKFKVVKFNQEKIGNPVDLGLLKIEQSGGQTKIYLNETKAPKNFPAVFAINKNINNNFVNFNEYLDMLNYRYNLTEQPINIQPSNIILTIDSIHKNYRLYTAESSYYNINIQ